MAFNILPLRNNSTSLKGTFEFDLINFRGQMNVFDQGLQHGDLENLIDGDLWAIQLRAS